MLLGEKILKLSPEKEAKNDCILFEASRYDKHFDYDPHYECKIDKVNITTVGTYPIFANYTNFPYPHPLELIKHIEAYKKGYL